MDVSDLDLEGGGQAELLFSARPSQQQCGHWAMRLPGWKGPERWYALALHPAPMHFLYCIPATNISLNSSSDDGLTTTHSHPPLSGKLSSVTLRPNLCPLRSEFRFHVPRKTCLFTVPPQSIMHSPIHSLDKHFAELLLHTRACHVLGIQR